MIKRLIDILSNPTSASQIQKEFCIKRKKDIECVITKVQKICKRKGWSLKIKPAICKNCGYTFSKREIKIPTQCPRCKSSWIDEPIFWIERK